MVGGPTNQQQQAPQLAHPSSSSSSAAHTATSEEDELLKRNTDCVYFLASPLTCKKGSECEYRHSDVARVNPRDCWYWLNGNCLNPKCAFRHPPLDGLLGSDASTPTIPPVPAPHATPFAVPKQGVACIFFQKGYCLKGHLCPFLHGPPNPVNNKPTQPAPSNPVTEPPKLVQKVDKKPVESFLPQVKQQQPPLPTRTGVDRKIAPPARSVPPPVMDEPLSNKPNRGVHHGYGKDADEYSREVSPGFDVLVDNQHEDSGPYHNIDHVDRDMYREHRDYDRYNEHEGHFDVDRVDHPERRSYPRVDRESESDLRHRISKQRRGSDNGLRPVDHVDRRSADHVDRIPRRDRDRDVFLSSRLRGRIKIPRRSVSPTKENNSRVEREIDIERRNLSRYSPGRPLSVSQTRVRDRINDTKFTGPKRLSELKSVRTEHQPNNEQSSGKRSHSKMEDDLSFEGPKPLSEILKRKRGVNNDTTNNNNNNDVMNNKMENVSENKEEHSSVSVDIDAENEKDKPLDGNNSGNYENEGGMVDEDALLDEELEAYDENRDGDEEYEYEQMEGEEEGYELEEGEEYVDEEDGEKESVVYS